MDKLMNMNTNKNNQLQIRNSTAEFFSHTNTSSSTASERIGFAIPKCAE